MTPFGYFVFILNIMHFLPIFFRNSHVELSDSN